MPGPAAHLLALVLLVAVACGGEDGIPPPVDVSKSLVAIATAAAAEKAAGEAPDWSKDPSMGGAFRESSLGTGEDLGSAWVHGLHEVAAMRDARVKSEIKHGATTDQLTSSRVSSTTFGEMKVQALFRDSSTEDDGKQSLRVEQVTRISHPLFTVKLFTSEAGTITEKASDTLAMVRTEWTTPTPLSGAQVAQACAAGGVFLAAQWSPPGETNAYLWFVALPGAVPAPTGEGYLLPLQAPAVALAMELRTSGLDHLLGAQVDRPAADTVKISWPQSQSTLTLRLDREGAVVGLNAEETITSTTGNLISLAKATLTAQAGGVIVRRGRCGETWQVPAH